MPSIAHPSALLLPLPIPDAAEAGHTGGNAAVEVIFVCLLLLLFWGAFRIMKKKRT